MKKDDPANCQVKCRDLGGGRSVGGPNHDSEFRRYSLTADINALGGCNRLREGPDVLPHHVADLRITIGNVDLG